MTINEKTQIKNYRARCAISHYNVNSNQRAQNKWKPLLGFGV